MKKRRAEIESFLMHDILAHGNHQSAWDWEADVRFADFIDHKDKDLIKQACYSGTVWPIIYKCIHETGIVRLRLKYLNNLAKCGMIKAQWIGTGEGGLNNLGTRRIRDYFIEE